MSNKQVQAIFAEAMKREHEKESKEVTQKSTQKITYDATQTITQKVTHISKRLEAYLTTEQVEDLDYSLRKIAKVRVNADVPLEWKDRLDDLAYKLKVGKYELMLYVIASFLGEVREAKK